LYGSNIELAGKLTLQRGGETEKDEGQKKNGRGKSFKHEKRSSRGLLRIEIKQKKGGEGEEKDGG